MPRPEASSGAGRFAETGAKILLQPIGFSCIVLVRKKRQEE